MAGRFDLAGVGPGDPELMTIKTIRAIKACQVLVLPIGSPELKKPELEEGEEETFAKECLAYRIACEAEPETKKKLRLYLSMPMIKEKKLLKEIHDAGARKASELLEKGKNLVFLTIGDPTVYSTGIYIYKRLKKMGYQGEIFSGIPSFCAAAARLEISLVENRQELHVLPVSYGIEEKLKLPGTKVLMKTGKKDGAGQSCSERGRTAGENGHELRNGWRKNLQMHRRNTGRCGIFFDCNSKGERKMIHFVGAGSGAVDLITVRGQKLLKEADIVVYAGSLVNPELLKNCQKDCQIYNSAKMTLEEVMEVMISGEKQEKKVVRLHTGDPCLYGAIKEQMDLLEKENISYKVCPGVSSFCGAASALNAEYTLPGISQSVVITRMAGRTPVPEKESIESFAAHQATMVIFLSTGMLEELSKRLIEGGYQPETPAAIVYKATWEDEKVCRCKVKDLAVTAKENGITKTALIVVGEVLGGEYERSLLYHPEFTTEFRQGKGKEGAGNV